jgi:hypothetical protein
MTVRGGHRRLEGGAAERKTNKKKKLWIKGRKTVVPPRRLRTPLN